MPKNEIDLTAAVEALARELACLEPGEPWPTNEELGGNLTGTRDDELRAGMEFEARDHLCLVLPLIEAALREKIAAEVQATRRDYQGVPYQAALETCVAIIRNGATS